MWVAASSSDWLATLLFSSSKSWCSDVLPPQYSADSLCIFYFFFIISWIERWTSVPDAVKSLWCLNANSLLFLKKTSVRHIERAGASGFTLPCKLTIHWMQTLSFECVLQQASWKLNPLMLNLRSVWAAGVGARSTADKCDAVRLLKQFDVSSCGAI